MMFENNAALDHRRRRVQAGCPLRPRVAKRPPPPTPERSIQNGATLSYAAARRRCSTTRHPELERVAVAIRDHLGTRVLRELLSAMSVRGATPRHVSDAEQFAELLSSRPVDVQLEWTALYGRLATSDRLRQEVLATLASPTFASLPDHLQGQLSAYVAGPTASPFAHQHRGAMLSDFWSTRSAEVRRMLLSRRTDAAGVERYLLEPDQPMHLLRTVADVDLVIVVFGDPRSPASLSYGRYYTIDDRGHAEASVVSPDPRVASGWRARETVTAKPFECRSTRLTRLEELALIEWLETNHAVTPDDRYRPRTVPYSLFANARKMHTALEPTANLFASIRGPLAFTPSRIRRGRVYRERTTAWTP